MAREATMKKMNVYPSNLTQEQNMQHKILKLYSQMKFTHDETIYPVHVISEGQ